MLQVSPRRLLQVKELIPAVRGDLDWIVMKALEKDRARRYETANGFAADIQRHLRSEPVLAGPPSRIYRMRKLVRRHRLAFAAGIIVGAGLLAGLAAASWGLHRERLARVRAESAERSAKNESRKSEQVSHILRNMLTGAAPEVARGRDTAVLREMVDTTAANVERDTRGQPEVEADVRTTLGSVYDALGEYAKAEGQFRQALALREKVFGPEHPQVAESLQLLGASLYHQRQTSEAVAFFRQALAMRRKVGGADGIEVAQSMNNLALALTLQAQTNEAASLRRDALALQVKLLGSNHIEVAISVHNLGNDLLRQRQYAEAEPYLRHALDLFQKNCGTNHPNVASAQHDLASALYKQGRNAEAETLFRDALRLKQQLYGPNHAEVAGTLRNLGSLLRRLGRLAEAEDCFRDALARARRGGFFSSRDLEECVYNAGSVVLDRAWAELESAPVDARGNPGLATRGREAETLLRECLALHLRTTGTTTATNDVPSANVRSHLAAALTLVAVTDDAPAPDRDAALATAEALLLPAHARLQTSASTAPELKRKAVLHLARLYQAWAKPDKAREWQTKLQEQKDLP
jgi:tetratricopeptide (TPR) repeat protein